jgi:hypothetical protein
MYIQGRWNKGAQGAQVPPPQVSAEIEAKTLPCHPVLLYFNPVQTKDSFLASEESLVCIKKPTRKTCIRGQ